ncbi:multisubunit sodium/proton antiporter, MrpD subunit [Halogranum amylolyticum]|uniref:Multisubunit sodium/proton antiporter, MrpD subunit n=1 Tax=Halogranum amylolyticum TaxID=660520 RepID=A0A1H8P7W9_9EURY|nr:proton-conducting transporter membrane subunit [Halogranum amylolyticum]SEO37613.1 multisubunit sodium/proton antiporter, MrpD subunit [Halogranum amylolyticum]
MTDIASLRPLAAVAVPAVAAVAILASGRRPNVREGWTILAAASTLALVASMVPGVLAGDTYVTDLGAFVPLGNGSVDFVLQADALGLLFGLLASLLWLVTSFYSIGYMRGLDEHAQTRYFASFAASVASAVGVALASNLLVLFVFYELLTVATYPLVSHDETAEARAAGRKYLAYTFGGGVAVLAGTVLIYVLAGSISFTPGGIEGLATADPTLGRAAFALLATGFGVKAALMPVHSWLPDAMVAPTPVSGLLHAVAVVKSGVFGIARVVLEVFGPDTVSNLGVGVPLAAVAAFTLLAASVIALRQDNLKRRLAYSTVSQLSYIVLGLGIGASMGGDAARYALVGGLLHIPAHAFMKLTLFFCAGAIHVETHTDDISDMAGIGKRMPLTMAAFGVAAAGMAGIPLVAGFVSKFYLLIGTASGGAVAFTVALLVSGVLNIAYFWPVVYQAFFESETPDGHDRKPLIENPLGGRSAVAADGGERNGGSNQHGATSGRPLADSDGEYAVDRNPSDHTRPGELETDTGETVDREHEEREGRDDHHVDHADHDHHHHGGPPAGGWERRSWLGGEGSWFVVAPILTAATGSVVLGLVPGRAVFLQLVEYVVSAATVVGVFA